MKHEDQRKLKLYALQKLRQGHTNTEVAQDIQLKKNLSRAQAWRIVKAARETPELETKEIISIAPVHIEMPGPEHVTHGNKEPEGPTAYTIAVLEDIKKLRQDEMNEAEPDKRVIIAAAQMEINAIQTYSKLITAARDASRDNVCYHPQHVKFRQELLDIIQGTELEPMILGLIRETMGPTNG
jgi:hypothetical protein